MANTSKDDKKSWSQSDVLEAWNKLSGRKDQYEVREFTNQNGESAVQLLDKDTGSLVVEAHGDNAWNELGEKAGQPRIDRGTHDEKMLEDDAEPDTTERGVPMTPTQPDALAREEEVTEVDNSKSVKTDNQRVNEDDQNRKSQPESRKADGSSTTVKGQ